MWQPITREELKELGFRITSRFVCGDDIEDLYKNLAKYPHEEWTMIRAPAWCGDKLVALVIKPREE